MKLIIDPNNEYPMHGLFFNLREKSFPIFNYIQIKDSSRYVYYDQWMTPEQLIENKHHPNGWASQNLPDQYIEVIFLNSSLKLKGYSIKTAYHSDEIPRNWRIICYDLYSTWIVDSHSNDISLNPEVKGGFATKSDEKMFPIKSVKNCRTIKIQSTGFNSRNVYHFEFAAFDLFGEFCTDNSCNLICKSIYSERCFNCIISYAIGTIILSI